jgi:hypothetical protein
MGKQANGYPERIQLLWFASTEETSRYVFRILALKEIMRNPEKIGFSLADQELQWYYRPENRGGQYYFGLSGLYESTGNKL